MTVCKYFQQGYCKFGRKCRFEHTKPNSYHDDFNERDSSRRNRHNDSSNYIRPAQFQNRHQSQQDFSSPFNRQNQDNNRQSQGFHAKKDDRYHWSSNSNRFAPLNDSRNEAEMSNPNKDDQALIRAVQDDVRTWTSCSMWPYSVYGSKTCLEGLADIQPEELRALFYLHGRDTYQDLMRQVDDMYTSRKSELMRMSEETKMSVLTNLHSSVDTNPSSCLTIFKMYGPGVDFNKGPSAPSSKIESSVEPIEASPTIPAFEQLQPAQRPAPDRPTPTQPVKSLFKSDVSAKLGEAQSRDCDEVYTDESILTEAELVQFKATSFTLGEIPMRPPPKGHCR